MKILLIQGVGHSEASGTWDADWEAAIAKATNGIAADVQLQYDVLPYDSIFANAKLDAEIGPRAWS